MFVCLCERAQCRRFGTGARADRGTLTVAVRGSRHGCCAVRAFRCTAGVFEGVGSGLARCVGRGGFGGDSLLGFFCGPGASNPMVRGKLYRVFVDA